MRTSITIHLHMSKSRKPRFSRTIGSLKCLIWNIIIVWSPLSLLELSLLLSSSFIIILISLSWLSLSSLLLLLKTLSPSKLNELHYPKYLLEFNSGNKLVFTFIFRKLFSILTQTVMSTSKLRWKVYMRRNQQLGCTPIGKKEIKIFFMATPDTQLSQPLKSNRKFK